MVERNKSTEWQFVFFTNEQTQQVGHLNRYQDIPNGLYLLINEYIIHPCSMSCIQHGKYKFVWNASLCAAS